MLMGCVLFIIVAPGEGEQCPCLAFMMHFLLVGLAFTMHLLIGGRMSWLLLGHEEDALWLYGVELNHSRELRSLRVF